MSGFFQSLSQGIRRISAVCGGVSGLRVVVAETPPTSASGSDDEGGDSDDSGEQQQAASLSSVRKIRFKNEGGMLKTLRGIDSAEQYLEAVMNWRNTPSQDVSPSTKSVIFPKPILPKYCNMLSSGNSPLQKCHN